MTTDPDEMIGPLGSMMERLYKTGGFLLVLALVGMGTLLVGGSLDGAVAVIPIATGAVILVGCLLIYAFAQNKGEDLRRFSARIEGCWWERITPGDSALSFCTLTADPFTCTVRLDGKAFDTAGNPIAWWWSAGSCLSLEECKLFYYWRGVHPLNSTDDFEGFGVLTFPRQTAPLKEGVGFFSDTVNGRAENTLKKSFVMSRCDSKQEQDIMREGTPAQRQELVISKLNQLP